MSRSFFKDNLASRPTKKAPGAVARGPLGAVARPPSAVAGGLQDTPAAVGGGLLGIAGNAPETPQDAPLKMPEIYGDVCVCRLLRVHRRVLDGARTAAARGRYWDVIGLHAGMTREWIQEYALERGIVPDFGGTAMKRIEPDNIVSVRLVGTHPNPCRCTVEIIATGAREFCSVRNLYQFPLHYLEAFDAMRVGLGLEWIASANECRY